MCGIVVYKGTQEAFQIVLEGLKKLEYRGYDSWGIAIINEDGDFLITKKVGKVGEAKSEKREGESKQLKINIGVGHTRWATHGGVTQKNAHPHLSMSGQFALVHNGIVENFKELKQELLRQGYKFKSETDTEVIVNLIEDCYYGLKSFNKKQRFKEAVRNAFKRLAGRNAIVVLDRKTELILGAREGSPLILGVNEKLKIKNEKLKITPKENLRFPRISEYFIASDIPAFLSYTNMVQYIDDGEMVVVDEEPRFFEISSGQEVKKRLIRVNLTAQEALKGKFKHFMIKEIMEQKETLSRAIEQDEKQIRYIAQAIKKAYGSFLVAAGTAGQVCHLGEYLFSKIAAKHINYVVASEFINFHHFLTPKSLVLAVSQSGETADVLEAIKIAKQKKAKIISIVNVPASSITRQSDYTFLIKAGPEKAVASTKATTAQIVLLSLLAYSVAGELKKGKRALIDLASEVNDMLNPRYEEHIKKLAQILKKEKDLYIIGRGLNYPIAEECAIKLQEVAYVHAQGLAGGELKHYALALIEKGIPVIVLVSQDENYEAILSNAIEIKSRGGYIIGVGSTKEPVFDYWIRVPSVRVELSGIVNLIPVQILAYHLGVLRGCDPDRPRNLAKSVTVK